MSSRSFRVVASVACTLLTACPARPPATDAPVTDATDAAPVDDGATDAPVTALPCTRVHQRDPSTVPTPFDGPHAAIEVYRDPQGIPHLYAHDDADAFFASGYMQATDRMFEMDLMRRSAAGTLAEVIGPEKRSQDETVRMVDIPRWGRESADRLRREDPAVFALGVAWVAGVNRRVREIRSGAVPPPAGFRATEFDYMPAEWTIDDPFAISRLILFRNANQLEYDILATILRDYVPAAAGLPIFQPINDATVMPPSERPMAGTGRGSNAPPGGRSLPPDAGQRLAHWLQSMQAFHSGGSNNWAVAATHSANGRPMIAGDPHQPLQSPSVVWAQHLNSMDAGGTLNVTGFAFVGTPSVELGHNDRIAWTATTTFPDIMDIWQVRAQAPGIVLGNATVPVQRCIETIDIKGQASEQYVVEDVPDHGVLLPTNFAPLPLGRTGSRLMLGWSGFRPTAEVETFVGLDRARNVTDFEAAVDHMEIGAFNFIAADAHDIAYRVHVLVPDRGPPAQLASPPYQLLDGADARTLWSGAWLPDTQLPHSRGADQGFLASANNDPFGFTANGRIDDDPWYYGAWFDPGTRAGRITTVLNQAVAAGPVTPEAMAALQLDTHSQFADDLIPLLVTAYSHVDTDAALSAYRGDARLTALVTALSTWDHGATRASAAAVVFEGWVNYFARDTLADDLSVVYAPIASAEPTYILKLIDLVANQRFTGADHFMQQGRDALALQALAQTRDWLIARFGDSDPSHYHWSDYHRASFAPPFSMAGPFDNGALATDGAEGTVDVSEGQFFDGDSPAMYHTATSGSVYRMVATFDADGTPNATVTFPRGNVGEPSSPFWTNTLTDWSNGVNHPMLFQRAEIEAASVEHTTILP